MLEIQCCPIGSTKSVFLTLLGYNRWRCRNYESPVEIFKPRLVSDSFTTIVISRSRHCSRVHSNVALRYGSHVMSSHVALRRVASCRVKIALMSHYVTSCHVMSRHVMSSCHVDVPHVTSWHVLRHVMSRHVTSHVTSCHCHVTFFPINVMAAWSDNHVTSYSRLKSRYSHATKNSLVNWLLPHVNQSRINAWPSFVGIVPKAAVC